MHVYYKNDEYYIILYIDMRRKIILIKTGQMRRIYYFCSYFSFRYCTQSCHRVKYLKITNGTDGDVWRRIRSNKILLIFRYINENNITSHIHLDFIDEIPTFTLHNFLYSL